MTAKKASTPATATASRAIIPYVVPIVLKPGVDPEAFRTKYNVSITADFLHWMFAKTSEKEFVDSIARAKSFLASLEKWVKAANEAMKGRIKLPDIINESVVTQGFSYVAVATLRERMDIDREKVKAEMGDEWYNARCSPVQYTEIRYKTIEKAGGGNGGESGNEQPE